MRTASEVVHRLGRAVDMTSIGDLGGGRGGYRQREERVLGLGFHLPSEEERVKGMTMKEGWTSQRNVGCEI